MVTFAEKLDRILIEFPIQVEPVQGDIDPENSANSIDRVDRQLIQSRKVIDDLAYRVEGVDYLIRIVPFNRVKKIIDAARFPGYRNFTDIGRTDDVLAKPGWITVVIDRAGPDPWTPWMVRHRIGHAITDVLRKAGKGPPIEYAFGTKKLIIGQGDLLGDVLIGLFRDVVAAYGLTDMLLPDGVLIANEAVAMALFRLPFGFRSARRGLVPDLGELKNELIADLLTHGRITLRDLPRRVNVSITKRNTRRDDNYKIVPARAREEPGDTILQIVHPVDIRRHAAALEGIIRSAFDSVVGRVLYSK